MSKIWEIARFSFKEAVRKKVLAGAVLLMLAYLALYCYGLFKMSEVNNVPQQLLLPQAFSLALFGAGFLVTLLAVLIAAGSIAGELETGTIYAVLSKPLTKSQFLLGKFLGYALFLTSFTVAFFLGLWGATYVVGGEKLPGMLPAMGIFIMVPVVMLTVTFFASTVFSTMTTGVVLFMLYGTAFIGGMIEQIGSLTSNNSLINAGIISSLILPVDALYRFSSYILMNSLAERGIMGALQSMGPFGSASVPSGWMIVYSVVYGAVFLLLALRIFRQKDL